MWRRLDALVSGTPFKRLGRDLWIVWLPLCLLGIYLFGFASEKYCSSASYRILDNGAKKGSGVDLGFLGFGASLGTRDEGVVEAYLCSMDALGAVDERFHLRELYRSSALDLFQRHYLFESTEDFLALYRKNLTIVTNELSGLTTISFMDTDPKRATEAVRFLLSLGEGFLNELNRQNAEKRVAFINEQLAEHREKLDAVIERLERFQKENGVVDPKADLEVQYAIIASLEKTVVEKRAQLNQLRIYMGEESIDIIRLKGEITEMEEALTRSREKLTGAESRRINALIYEYEAIKSELDFCREIYKQALVQSEVGRMEALQQAKVLEVITTPSLPDEYSRPEKAKLMLTALVLLFLLSRISRLVFAVIEDHKD